MEKSTITQCHLKEKHSLNILKTNPIQNEICTATIAKPTIVVGVVIYELAAVNPIIHAKLEQQSDNNNISNNYSAKLVVIKANDARRQTFIITQTDFTGIQSNLIVSSTNTNSPVNATLNNIANFLIEHSGPPPKHNPPVTIKNIQQLN